MKLWIRFKLRENVTSVFKELLCERGETDTLLDVPEGNMNLMDISGKQISTHL